MLRRHQLENLLGGVSQQPAGARLPNQCSEQINCGLSLTRGLSKRNPSRHVGQLVGFPALVDRPSCHVIDRDRSEAYLAAAGNAYLAVFDMLDGGAPVSLSTRTDWAYLTTADPKEDLRWFSVDDYTFVVNRAIQPTMTASVYAAQPEFALINIVLGNYESTYTVSVIVGGLTRTIRVTTNDGIAGGLAEVRTTAIARDIEQALEFGLPGGYSIPYTLPSVNTPNALVEITVNTAGFDHTALTVERAASVLRVSKASGSFSISVEDSAAGDLLELVKEKVTLISDLPSMAKDGDTVIVEGEVGKPVYYATFDADAGTSGIATGVWKEGHEPGITYEFDEDTMPHLLIRQSDGSFLFTPADGHTTALDSLVVPSWDDREVGDEATNPVPPFVGKTIGDVSFYQGRLVIAAGEDIALSEVNEPFSFWRTTVASTPASDRLLLQASHNKVNDVRWMVPLEGQLVVMTDRTQFSLRIDPSSETFKPSIAVATDYAMDTACRPRAAGRSVFLPLYDGTHGGLRQMVDASTNAREAKFAVLPISAQAPNYVLGRPFELAVDEQLGFSAMIAETASGNGYQIWVYQWAENGGELVLSSWHQWQLDAAADLRYIATVNQQLYFVTLRGGKFWLDAIDLRENLEDVGLEWDVRLDRKVSSDDCTIGYDGGTGISTVTLPYDLSPSSLLESTFALTAAVIVGEADPLAGTVHYGVPLGTNQILFLADLRTADFVVGETYTAYYAFSPIYLQEETRRGLRPVPNTRISLRRLVLFLEDTGALQVLVADSGRGNQVVTSITNVGDAPYRSFDTVERRVALMVPASRALVALVNTTPLPMFISTGAFESYVKSFSSPAR